MPKQFQTREYGQDHPHQPHLSPRSIQEAITFMLKGFGEFPDALRISLYDNTLEECSTEEIWQAVKTWMRYPHDRPAKPGELRDLIFTARNRPAPIMTQAQQWESHRITPEEKQEVIKGLTPKAREFLEDACPWLFQ